MATKNDEVYEWILRNAEGLYAEGTSCKAASRLATAALGFNVTPRRLSRVARMLASTAKWPWHGRDRALDTKHAAWGPLEWERLRVQVAVLSVQQRQCPAGATRLVSTMSKEPICRNVPAVRTMIDSLARLSKESTDADPGP